MFFLIKQYFTLLFLWKRDFTVYVDVSRACWTSSTIIRSSLYWKHSFSDLLQKLVPCRQAACFNHTDRLHHWTTPCGFKRNKQDTALKHRVRAHCSEIMSLKGNTHDMIKAVGFTQNVSHRNVGSALLHTLHGNSDAVSIQMQILHMEWTSHHSFF